MSLVWTAGETEQPVSFPHHLSHSSLHFHLLLLHNFLFFPQGQLANNTFTELHRLRLGCRYQTMRRFFKNVCLSFSVTNHQISSIRVSPNTGIYTQALKHLNFYSPSSANFHEKRIWRLLRVQLVDLDRRGGRRISCGCAASRRSDWTITATHRRTVAQLVD